MTYSVADLPAVSSNEASESKPPVAVGTSKPRTDAMGMAGVRVGRLLLSVAVTLKHRVEVEADVATRWRAAQKSVESIIVGSEAWEKRTDPRQR
jgi:hypothetical protein